MKHQILTLLLNLGIATFAIAQQSFTNNIKQSLLADGLTNDDVDELLITKQFTSKHNQVTHIYFTQQYKGIPFYNANGSMHVKNASTVAFNHTFVKQLSAHAISQSPKIDAIAALQKTANHLQLTAPSVLSKKYDTDKSLLVQDPAASTKPIKVQLYYLVNNGSVKLVYNTNWLDNKSNTWWNVRVDANTGEFIEQNTWSISCNHDAVIENFNGINTHHNHSTNNYLGKKDSGPSYRSLPLRIESPMHGSRELINNPADSNASPFGWHDLDGLAGHDTTITFGNNVHASDDITASDKPGLSPDGGDSLVFDYPYDVTQSSTYNLNAAITNLFVWNNYIHDIMYQYGFDEESGNFQLNNYGKGGLGNDYVKADAQDGSGTNNANFQSPPDGQNGRMQMFLWNKSGISNTKYITFKDLTTTDSVSYVIAQFGARQIDFTNTAVDLVRDSNATTFLGCTKVYPLAGKIAVVDRGTCSFVQKVKILQNAGAIMAVVINNTTQPAYTMPGTDASITIPAVMISKAYGDLLKQRLQNGSVTASANNMSGVIGAFDSDLDNGVISHEYGHGISIRLTGGAANSNCLSNQEQMGEGWSDFFGLVLTHQLTDSANGGRGVGTWLNGQPVSGLGIRTHKYSRNSTLNPLTYDNIKTASVPHGVGTVWCSMLYDLYWNLIDKYGYDNDMYYGKGGNNRALQLVIDGLKLQPCNPGFADARDAIIKANILNNNGEDTMLIWQTFAKRGLGYSANQGLTTSRSDGSQAFDLPDGKSALNELFVANATIACWPNPTKGMFELQLPFGVSTLQTAVYDLTGREVFNKTLEGTGTVLVDVGDLQNGIYFVKAYSQGKIYATKIVVSR